jgi:hypothetical protein
MTSDDSPEQDDSLEQMVDDGLLIVAAALRLSLKNQLILRLMRTDAAYDPEAMLSAARAELRALLAERQSEATRLLAVRDQARLLSGPARTRHDYREADLPLLDLRIQVNRRLSDRLGGLLDDRGFLEDQIRAARDAALDEIVQARVPSGSSGTNDPEDRGRALNELARDISRLKRRARRDRLVSGIRSLARRGPGS